MSVAPDRRRLARVDTASIALETAQEEAIVHLLRWRFERLCQAGYDPGHATILATHWDIDLRAAVDLVERGCPSALALDILL